VREILLNEQAVSRNDVNLSSRRKSINNFQVGRWGYEQERKRKFPEIVNPYLASFGLEIEALGEPRGVRRDNREAGVPDYVVKRRDSGESVAYLEAEFVMEGRWPTGQPFKYETVRWPDRKYQYYTRTGGLYEGLPVFMISIRGGDLGDAYYIDARIWIKKAKKERVRGSIFWAISRDDEELGRGLEGLGKYIIEKVERNS